MLLNLKVINIIILCKIIFAVNPLYVYADKIVGKLNDQVIDYVNFFVDREEETQAIDQNLKLYRIASIIGVTSIGKTEIVRKYASVNKRNYDLIWFFDSNLDLKEQFTTLANKINETLLKDSNNKISEEPYSSQHEVMKYLTEQKNWLLVFDNLKLNQNSMLKKIIDWKHNGHVIICSQDSKYLPNVTYIHKLNKEYGEKLLQKILGNEIENKDLTGKLLEIFDGYPSQIVQGALLLKENNYLSLEEYKNILIRSDDPIKSHMEFVLKLLTDNDQKILKYIAILNNQKFSKNFLKMISEDQESVGESLYNLNRFGLIKNTTNNIHGNFFEMHDVVRDSILQFTTLDEVKHYLTNIIDKLNKLMPQGVTSSYAFINSDTTIKSNLEILLENAEQYNVNIYNILELRKNLINYYMAELDYYNWEKMKIWFEHKEQEKFLDLNKMDNAAKANYCWYLVDMGMYEDFVKASYMSALDYFNKAQDVVEGIADQPELKSTVLFQLAQTQVFGGDAQGAIQNINKAEDLINKYPNADFDMGLYWFIKARIALTKGNYAEALTYIDNNIKAEAHLPAGTFTAPTYIMKSEILNFMGMYKESHEIIKRIKNQEIDNQSLEHEIHARILAQLSRAELGIGLKEEALNNATIACNIFQKDIEKQKIESVLNSDFATALVIKGNALAENNEFELAFQNYNKAETIYFRKYNVNYKNMDDISYLLSQGAKAACHAKSPFWKKHFFSQLINYFGKDHFRTKEVEKICLKSGI